LIARLTGERLLRLHVVGDAKSPACARVLAKACEDYAKRGFTPHAGKKVWTYTHSWRDVPRKDWGSSVSVLASTESARDAKEAMKKGYAVALVVPHHESESAYRSDGLTLIPCPNQTRAVTCDKCGLCRDDDRLKRGGLVIAFAAHGKKSAAMAKRLSLEMI
jgi:hypothetical protein